MKSLSNIDTNGTKKNVSDLIVYGTSDLFKLLSKASSVNEGWMKSTKAMEIEGVGCVVQVTTQQVNRTGFLPISGPKELAEKYSGVYPQFDSSEGITTSVIAEAVTFVPGVKIESTLDGSGIVIARKLVKI